jgi:hypothetical protein
VFPILSDGISENAGSRDVLPAAGGAYGVIFLVFLVYAWAFITVVVPRTYPVAPADGLVYADAFDRALAGRVTVRGDTILRPTLDLVACSPVVTGPIRSWLVPAGWNCRSDEPPPEIRTTAWIHPPTSFFLDAAVARIIAAVRGRLDAFTAGRLAGGLWFALGGTLTVFLAALWGAAPWRSAAVLAAFLPTPLFFSLFTYVTPDRFALAVGSLVLIAGTLWWRGQLAVHWLFLAGLVSGGVFKQTFILAAIGLVALVLSLWWQARRTGSAGRTGRDTVIGMAWLLAGGLIGVVGWHFLKHRLGVELPPRTAPDLFTVEPGLNGAIGILFQHAFLTPLGDNLGGTLEPLATVGLAALLALALAGAAFGAVFYADPAEQIFPLALAAILTIGPGGLAISMLGGVSSGNWLPPSPRYTLAAFPLYVLPLLAAADRRVVWLGGLITAAVGLAAWAAFQLA